MAKVPLRINQVLLRRNRINSQIVSLKEEAESLSRSSKPQWGRISKLNADRRALEKTLQSLETTVKIINRPPGGWVIYAKAFMEQSKLTLSKEQYTAIDDVARMVVAERADARRKKLLQA